MCDCVRLSAGRIGVGMDMEGWDSWGSEAWTQGVMHSEHLTFRSFPVLLLFSC